MQSIKAFPGNMWLPESVVVIGAGTGGPQALAEVLPRFPSNFPGTILVVQQMRHGFTRVLANQFNSVCSLPVAEAVDGQILRGSQIILAPGGTCMTIAESDDPSLDHILIFIDDIHDDPEKLRTRTNDTMISAARLFGRNTIGVLLTGLGDDGREGMRAIAEAGGITLAQDETSSVVHDLPSSAIAAGVAHEVLPLWSIADRMIHFLTGGANANAA